jgi:hypothetical protein
MPKSSEKVNRKPPKQAPVHSSAASGWDLTEVETDYLFAELIRRGFELILGEKEECQKKKPKPGRAKSS